MIPPIKGWRRVELGEVTVLVPSDGTRSGTIHYHERCTPVAPLETLIAEHVGADPTFTPELMRACDRFFTHEGELSAHVIFDGTRSGGVAELHLGFVITDDFYARVQSLVTSHAETPRYTSLVRQLIQGDSHHLGVRPRRPIHAAPEGWTRLERGLRTDFLTPGFPQVPSAVSVYPAMPRAAHDARPLAELLVAHGAAGPGRRTLTPQGLRGARWDIATTGLPREVIVVQHGDYVYALRADGDCDTAVLSILDSLIPFPQLFERGDDPLFEHWTM